MEHQVIKRWPYIYVCILITIFLIVLFNTFTSHAGLVSGQTRYFIQDSSNGGRLHNSGGGDKYVDIYPTNEAWIIEPFNGGYTIKTTTGKQYYIDGRRKFDVYDQRRIFVEFTSYKNDISTLTLGKVGNYYYIGYKGWGWYLKNVTDNGWNRVTWTSKSEATLWDIIPEHTHNSSGVEYGQYNGTYHYKYTFCNGHGGDHSQNRGTTTEAHSFGGWSGWSNYSTSQQRRSRTCSKCGYVEYGYQARPYTINLQW